MNLPQIQSNIQLRLAAVEEASSIASVLYQSFVEYEPAYTPEAFAATTPTRNQIENRFNGGPVWGALQNDGIVGTVSAVPKGEAVYIRSMAILPTARGQGIGKLLLRQVERFAYTHGYKRLFLSTTLFSFGLSGSTSNLDFDVAVKALRICLGRPCLRW